WHFVPGMYNFPYRVLYSKDIDNLFIGGRLISATHVAMSSTRIMCTCAVGGQAIGTAASLCKGYGLLPRAVADTRIKTLQEALIDDDQTIMGFADQRGVSPLQNARIGVSSTKAYENVLDAAPYPLKEDTCLALPCQTRIDSVEIRVAGGAQAQALTVEGYAGMRPENYIPEEHVKTFAVTIA
ncbi:MAG TPA: FAD-dependent oxidoreductase, partial [Clostridia bacterium]|nr:FAD-dependent oxidoreductase [Clostridia bacterium]